jgi:hypothetical protein
MCKNRLIIGCKKKFKIMTVNSKVINNNSRVIDKLNKTIMKVMQ